MCAACIPCSDVHVVDPLNDDLLDHDMRRRILEVTEPGFRAASWRAQYQLLRGIEPAWADAWLTVTRAALTAAGADRAVLDMLPTPS